MVQTVLSGNLPLGLLKQKQRIGSETIAEEESFTQSMEGVSIPRHKRNIVLGNFSCLFRLTSSFEVPLVLCMT